jgi:predicted amidophosphoribosyltransferase
MFCPQCKAEYRPGATHCSDCDVELVEELSESDNSSENELPYYNLETLKSVWTGQDQARCVSLCERLKAAGIPFLVNQHQRQSLFGVDEHYKIGVPPEFFNDARKMIIKGRLDPAD